MTARFTKYSWGWDVGPVFGYWLVWSHCEGKHLYVSNDATPPYAGNTGLTLFRRWTP